MRLQPSSNATNTTSAKDRAQALCFASDAVGDCVSVVGDELAGKYQVTKTDIDSSTFDESVSIGIISLKLSSTECIVHLLTELRSVYTGMTPGSLYYVGADSRPTDIEPGNPGSGTRTSQIIGYAVASDVLYINPSAPIQLLPIPSIPLTISDFRRNIVLSGLQNGVNLVYTTPEKFLRVPFAETMSRNGVIQEEGADKDYIASESAGVGTGYNTITLLNVFVAPLSWERLSIDYLAAP